MIERNLQIEMVKIDTLKPYKNNAKLHPEEQIAQIILSIQEFGFNDPIAVDEKNVIIEGHGRLIAAQKMGLIEVPVIRLDKLTDEQKKAYIIAHNKLTMNTDFNLDILQSELDSIKNINMETLGFGLSDKEAMLALIDEQEEEENRVQRKKKTIVCPECGHKFEA